MGHPRRERVRLLTIIKRGLKHVATVLALSVLLTACSGSSLDATDLLLGTSDFPGIEVTETTTRATDTPQGVSAAQVQISGPDFELSHSVVLFATPASALSVLAGINQDQLAQGVVPPAVPSGPDQPQDSSGILVEVRDGQETLTMFLVEGRALIRLTVSGPDSRPTLESHAEKARSKAKRQ